MQLLSIILALCVARATTAVPVNDENFDKLVNMVVSYINFTSTYVLPKNNAARSHVDDNKVHGKTFISKCVADASSYNSNTINLVIFVPSYNVIIAEGGLNLSAFLFLYKN